MNFEIKDLIYIIGIVVSAVISFLGTRYKMKEYIRDKIDEIKKEINEINKTHLELKFKDELQQQVLDQIGKQIDELIPKLVDGLNNKKLRK